VHLDFKREYDFYKSNRKQWLKDQKIGMSQFSVEVNPEPSQDLFVSLGRLLWCSSLFEEKLTRAVFWLSSLYRGELSDLPGQGVKLSSRIGQLNKLLHENIIVEIVGVHSVEWTRETMKGLVPSIEFRDDVVHGHHQGNWYPDHVFRAPGKSFHVESSKSHKRQRVNCE